jgi:hypothetical protein
MSGYINTDACFRKAIRFLAGLFVSFGRGWALRSQSERGKEFAATHDSQSKAERHCDTIKKRGINTQTGVAC